MRTACTIPAKSITKVLTFAATRGVDPVDVICAAGLERSVGGNPLGKIRWTQLIAAYESAARMSSDGQFGLHLGEQTTIQKEYRELGYIAANSPNLGESLRRFSQYASIWSDSTRFSLEVMGQQAIFRWQVLECSPAVARQANEYLLAMLIHNCRLLTDNQNWKPTVICMESSRSSSPREYNCLARTPVLFGKECNALVLELSALQIPLPHADLGLLEILIGKAEEALTHACRHSTSGHVVDEVRNLLRQYTPGNKMRLSTIARQLGMSMRTLERKLREQGTSHRLLLEEVRHELAIHYLTHTTVAIAEIAFTLGFSEHSAFDRAFHRWNGTSPREYRNRFVSTTRDCS